MGQSKKVFTHIIVLFAWLNVSTRSEPRNERVEPNIELATLVKRNIVHLKRLDDKTDMLLNKFDKLESTMEKIVIHNQKTDESLKTISKDFVEVKKGLTHVIDEAKKEVGAEIGNIKSEITQIGKSIKDINATEHKLVYTGSVKPSGWERIEANQGIPIEECFTWCTEKRKTDEKWNALIYIANNKRCDCFQNPKGHFKLRSGYGFYRFV